MFPLTRRADYALRIMLELGDKTDSGQRVPAAQIAQHTNVPVAFLRKIVADLSRAGLVRTYPGPSGGLTLAQPATTINLAHILNVIEGPICLNTCLVRPRECPRDHTCAAHNFLARLQQNLVQQLQEATLDKLITEKRELEHHSGQSNIQITLS